MEKFAKKSCLESILPMNNKYMNESLLPNDGDAGPRREGSSPEWNKGDSNSQLKEQISQKKRIDTMRYFTADYVGFEEV